MICSRYCIQHISSTAYVHAEIPSVKGLHAFLIGPQGLVVMS